LVLASTLVLDSGPHLEENLVQIQNCVEVQNEPMRERTRTTLLSVYFLQISWYILDLEKGGGILLRNVGELLPD
jgi:hypothetical protein